MGELNTDTSILITGGFHTEGMTEIMRQNGIAYTVISPKIMESSGKQKYTSLMTNKMSPFEKILAYEGRKLAFFNVFHLTS